MAVRWTAIGGGVLLVAAAGLLLALPVLVDQPHVHAALEARLARLLQGAVTWNQLDVRLLPYPHGMVERLRIEIPGKLDAQVGRTEVELGLWPLLHGEVVLTALHAEDPWPDCYQHRMNYPV